jgi:hypothetical protein
MRILEWVLDTFFRTIPAADSHKDLPAQHGKAIEDEMLNDLVKAFEDYRNFPMDRGFKITMLKRGQYIATDDLSEYWLNRSNYRWICMSGPDLDLPRNDRGDCNDHNLQIAHKLFEMNDDDFSETMSLLNTIIDDDFDEKLATLSKMASMVGDDDGNAI